MLFFAYNAATLIFFDLIWKKIFLICFLLLSTPLLAESVDQFLIKISNAMPTDCTLKDQVILFGHVSDHATTSGRRKSILLAYACGDNPTAIFFTDITPFQGMLVSDGYVLKANKINLYFSEKQNDTGHMADKSPIEVLWRLTR